MSVVLNPSIKTITIRSIYSIDSRVEVLWKIVVVAAIGRMQLQTTSFACFAYVYGYGNYRRKIIVVKTLQVRSPICLLCKYMCTMLGITLWQRIVSKKKSQLKRLRLDLNQTYVYIIVITNICNTFLISSNYMWNCDSLRNVFWYQCIYKCIPIINASSMQTQTKFVVRLVVMCI